VGERPHSLAQKNAVIYLQISYPSLFGWPEPRSDGRAPAQPRARRVRHLGRSSHGRLRDAAADRDRDPIAARRNERGAGEAGGIGRLPSAAHLGGGSPSEEGFPVPRRPAGRGRGRRVCGGNAGGAIAAGRGISGFVSQDWHTRETGALGSEPVFGRRVDRCLLLEGDLGGEFGCASSGTGLYFKVPAVGRHEPIRQDPWANRE